MTASAAQERIIHAHHTLSRWRRWLSWSMTLLCWVLWLFLWWPVVAFLLGASWTTHPHWFSLRGYAAVAAALGALLVLWARVNLWRFRAHEQRRLVRDVTPEELARDLGLTQTALLRGRSARILVVHHYPAGGIASLVSADEPPQV